jgi:hypothetical protein
MILLFIIGLLIVQVYSASSSCTGPIHIKSQSDLDSIRSCQEIDGSVYIQNITTDSVLNLSQLQHVRGDLIISGNHDVSQVVLASLQQVDGQLKLQDNSGLNRLDLTQLTFTQSMELSVDPLLDTIRFPSGLSQIESLTITDTGAEKIEGLTMSKIKHVNIANNAHLTDINLNHLQSVGGVLSIAANSPNLTLDVSDCYMYINVYNVNNKVYMYSFFS